MGKKKPAKVATSTGSIAKIVTSGLHGFLPTAKRNKNNDQYLF
jgi:hypothetical protein